MTLAHRVLHPKPVETLAEYVEHLGGGAGLAAARQLGADALIERLRESGLRGRGGAGFPTGVKWRSVRDNLSATASASVVVNGAEGEPGTFKDRTILRNNPYRVLEGALIAAVAADAERVIIGLKASFGPELARVRGAIAEIETAGWAPGVRIDVFEGPNEYLYGEETALLETIDGRYPFPRIAPPFRRGVDELVTTASDVRSESGLSTHVVMAGPDSETGAPPALVDNVETMANVPRIVARGVEWFRADGTEQSPGTIIATITGDVQHAGVGEVLMGTTLRQAIQEIAGGPRPGREIVALLPGVSGALVPAAVLDTPMTYEDMAAAGSGLGSASFRVVDDASDVVAVVAGASRFLAVESCGQCSPCKQDGLALADALGRLSHSDAHPRDLATVEKRSSTVADGARCSLGRQQQAIVESLLTLFPDAVAAHVDGRAAGTPPAAVAELEDLADGVARIDERHATKQPDWSYDRVGSGQAPVERYTDHRRHQTLDE